MRSPPQGSGRRHLSKGHLALQYRASVVDSDAGSFPQHEPRAAARRAGRADQTVLYVVLFYPSGPAWHFETVLGSSSYFRRAGTYGTYAATTADGRPRDRRQGTVQSRRRNARHPWRTSSLQSRPRRLARVRRHRRTPLPCGPGLDPWRLPRGRGLLRYQRLPHNRAPARGVAPEGLHRPKDLLAAAREEAPPRALRVASGYPGLRRGLPAWRGSGAARRCAGCFRVRDQLVSDLGAGVLLRSRRASFAATTSVVARRRRAVLPDLASDPRPRALFRGDAPQATALADRSSFWRRGIGSGYGASLHARRGPVQDLLRYRHARYGVALWSRARLSVVARRQVPSFGCAAKACRSGTVQAPLGMDCPTPSRYPWLRRTGGPRLVLSPPR